MGGLTRDYQIGGEVTPLAKNMTQEAINLFEGSSGETGPSQFTDEESARETLGTSGTVASGRMSLTFAIEMLRRYFGADVFNHTGSVDLRFLRAPRRHHHLFGSHHRGLPGGQRQQGHRGD